MEQGRRRGRIRPRRKSTSNALIEKAEAMFADKGIDGVSLRQIGVAIGSANANVVGYHFGTKEKLLKVIFLRNRPRIEARRAELLAQLLNEAKNDENEITALIGALCRPLFECTNADGRHTYAGFLRHISRSKWATRLSLMASLPVTRELLKRLAMSLPNVPDNYFRERMHALGDIVTGVLQRIDANHVDGQTAELLFSDALRMANAVLTTPVAREDRVSQARRTTGESKVRSEDAITDFVFW